MSFSRSRVLTHCEILATLLAIYLLRINSKCSVRFWKTRIPGVFARKKRYAVTTYRLVRRDIWKFRVSEDLCFRAILKKYFFPARWFIYFQSSSISFFPSACTHIHVFSTLTLQAYHTRREDSQLSRIQYVLPMSWLGLLSILAHSCHDTFAAHTDLSFLTTVADVTSLDGSSPSSFITFSAKTQTMVNVWGVLRRQVAQSVLCLATSIDYRFPKGSETYTPSWSLAA